MRVDGLVKLGKCDDLVWMKTDRCLPTHQEVGRISRSICINRCRTELKPGRPLMRMIKASRPNVQDALTLSGVVCEVVCEERDGVSKWRLAIG